MMRRCRGPRNWQLRRQLGKDHVPGIQDNLAARWNPPQIAESAIRLPESALRSRLEKMREKSFTFPHLRRSRPAVILVHQR